MIAISDAGIWTTANEQGDFMIKDVKAGKIVLSLQYLGYIKRDFELLVQHDISNLILLMEEDNLKLAEVVITATKGKDLATSFNIDRKALEHLQMLNVTDVSSLLPGGKTNTEMHLATGVQRFQVNSKGISESGNPTFGVGLEVDGVRLSNNASRGSLLGPDTRNIASSNVESIEVITGVASVEYGDISDGIVKINTRKGISSYILEATTQPNTKQISLNKGLSLGGNNGVLNFNIEHVKSIKDLASPYTSYVRNGLSLNYSNTFNQKSERPLVFNFGVTGNMGGAEDLQDPDRFVNTFSKDKDNVFRSNFMLRWLTRSKWITNIEATASLNYNDRKAEDNTVKSATSSVAALHTTQTGYHIGETYLQNPAADIILVPSGNWYEKRFEDNKLLNYSGKIKANQFKKFGLITNNLMIGAEYSGSQNRGQGVYYNDLSLAPTWRPYDYKQESAMNNFSFYAEDKLNIPLNSSRFEFIAGLRTDLTTINGSEYGSVSSWSPRFNARYAFLEDPNRTVRNLSFQVGWGKSVKLPGFSTLYAQPSYRDLLTFAPGTTVNGETFYAYYTESSTRIFNPALKWQSNNQLEFTFSANIGGNRITLIAAQNKTVNPYQALNVYREINYKFTGQESLENSAIPIERRIYSVDQHSGIVTVNDKTGALPDELLDYQNRYVFGTTVSSRNAAPVTRNRLSWIIDFKKIEILKTSLRLDGNYYYYKNIENTLDAYMPNSTINMANGQPYRYIGFFAGGASSANGSLRKSLDMNLTVTTHIPAVRLILSARLEASFYNFSQALSQTANGPRGFVLDNREDFTPSKQSSDIYGGDRYIAVYPEYYVDKDNMDLQIPFAEKFIWAKENDAALYNELAKMVIKTGNDYTFNPNKISAYYSVNFGVTKEIGRIASLSFNAKNFNNNMAMVRNSANGGESSLFDSSNIPALYYGLSLRLKF